ncbi:MAG: NAD(+) diphosphatase [Pseudomonadota bacterium]
MAPENLFAGSYLDRRAEARLDGNWLAEARGDAHTLYVAMRHGAALVRQVLPGAPRLALLHGTDARVEAVQDPESLVLLGWYEERCCVLVDLPDHAPGIERDGEALSELRPIAAELPVNEAGLFAYARALNLWRGNHRYCSRCGTSMQSERAGHLRRCPACDYQSFPRLDPAIIVLVHDGDAVLLGRQAGWPPGRYSTIAGFVEPGESLEDAVKREVFEETGVIARDIAYHSSQPWPFPSSLMLGFTAMAAMTTPVLRDGELEDARWFSREELRNGTVGLPPAISISRHLIESWLQHAA